MRQLYRLLGQWPWVRVLSGWVAKLPYGSDPYLSIDDEDKQRELDWSLRRLPLLASDTYDPELSFQQQPPQIKDLPLR